MWGDLLFAWGGLVVQPVVGVGVGVGDVVGLGVFGGVGVAGDGENEVGIISCIEYFTSNFCYRFRNGDRI